jgi:hypothetical protein
MLAEHFIMDRLDHFGIDETFFPIDLQQSLFLGFISMSCWIKVIMIFLVFCLSLTILVFLLQKIALSDCIKK